MLDIETAVQALIDAGVDFIIIGGWSAILHGSAQLTKDLDLFFSRRPENLRRIANALGPFHPRLRDVASDLPFIWEAATLANGTFFTLTTDVGPIDLLAEVSGLGSFEEIRAKSVQADAFGRRVRTLDLKSLIESKRAAGRPKDVIALRELESLLEAKPPE